MARSATARRPTRRRPDRLDRSSQQHLPKHARSAPAFSSGSPLDDATVPAAPLGPAPQASSGEVTPAVFWDLLSASERERLGLRLSHLVLKAVRSSAIAFQEDA